MARCFVPEMRIAAWRKRFSIWGIGLACLLACAGLSATAAEDSAKENEMNPYLAKQLALAKQGNVWAKYELYAAYRQGRHGVKADLRQADHWAGEIARGLHLVAFAPAGGFRPATPGEFLAEFGRCSSLNSAKDRIGGASFFRTKAQGGRLIASFLTEMPDKMIADLKGSSRLTFLWRAEVTPAIFVMHESSVQESLQAASASGQGRKKRPATASGAKSAAPAPPALDRPTEDIKFAPAGSDADATILLERVLKSNKPWLDPKPIEATYSLLRTAGSEEESLGPYTVTVGCKPALRVGSLVWTPLHSMASKVAKHTARMLGKFDWKGKSLVAVEVAFEKPVRNTIGFGGQTGTSYSHSQYSVATARILIEPNKAVPLFIDSWSPAEPQTNTRRYHVAWTFGPEFLPADGGLVPAALEWNDPSFVRERQTFQVADGAWIFKQGDAWYGPSNALGGSGHIQRLELRDLKITKAAK